MTVDEHSFPMHYNEIYLVHAYSFCTSYLATCTACIRPKLHTFGMHWLQRWHSACHSGAAETLIAGLGFQRASSCIGSSCHLLQILRVHPLACLHIKTDNVSSTVHGSLSKHASPEDLFVCATCVIVTCSSQQRCLMTARIV